MSELYIPTPILEAKSNDFYICPTGEEFSPLVLDQLQWALAKKRIDLESQKGIEYLYQLSSSLYSPTDPDHGWQHIQTVMHHGQHLAQLYEINDQERYALFSAICLHDVIRCGVNNPAILSAGIAEQVLSPYMRPKTVQMAVDAIAQHSSGSLQRYNNDFVPILMYEADKSHTDRLRWLLPWGFDPSRYTIVDNKIAPIEKEYEYYLEMVHGTAATHYLKNIIEPRMEELQALKNASGY